MSRLKLFQLIKSLRDFFSERDFLETPTPPLVGNPGMESHLHPFQVRSVHRQENLPLYLHTSPEFYMKKLLSEGMEKIYQISYSFRDEPQSTTHRPQFLMLEWYRANAHYHVIKQDVIDLIQHSAQALNLPYLKPEQTTVEELFQQYLNFSILDHLDCASLEEKIRRDFPHLLAEKPEQPWPWEDYFFLLFLNEIEPHFKNQACLIIDEFPAPLAALSKISKRDQRVCERFEVYLHGLEVANCFHELTDLDEQEKRMKKEAQQKSDLYHYQLPEPQVLYEALTKGIPTSSGIALGVERLLMGLTNQEEGIFLD